MLQCGGAVRTEIIARKSGTVRYIDGATGQVVDLRVDQGDCIEDKISFQRLDGSICYPYLDLTVTGGLVK